MQGAFLLAQSSDPLAQACELAYLMGDVAAAREIMAELEEKEGE